MSWIERTNTDLKITTGDGKEYLPWWVNASKNVEFNISTFEFKNLQGSLVHRGEPMGTRYAIEISFQGENHLDVSAAFDASSRDKNPWTVSHPLYGSIICHPSSLTYDNSKLNVTKITGMLLETISDNEPTSVTVSPVDKITSDAQRTEDALTASLVNGLTSVSVSETTKTGNTAKGIYNKVSNLIKDSADAANYFNAYNSLMGYINNGGSETIRIARDLRAFSTLPYTFLDTVSNRVAMFELQYNELTKAITGLFSRTSKRFFELQGGMAISGIAQSSVTNTGEDYNNANDVFPVIETLLNTYNDYVFRLDALKSETGDTPNSYIPNAEAMSELSNLVSYTVNSLFSIAVKGRKQRRYILDRDSNLIQLAHQLYGIASDENIQYLIATNKFSLTEYLQVKKGREIIYYQ
jgi:hypothetical protein